MAQHTRACLDLIDCSTVAADGAGTHTDVRAGKGYFPSSLVGESSIAIAQAYPPAQAHKRSPCKSCPLDKVRLNGNCPSAMRTHSTVSLSLLCMPEPARPSLTLPRNVDLQGAVLTLLLRPFPGLQPLNEKECLLCTVEACTSNHLCVCVPRPCGGSLGCRSVQTVPPRIGSELELRSLAPAPGPQVGTSEGCGGSATVTTRWCQHLPQGRNVETVNTPSK